jgi:hypothetical protein
VKSVISFIGLLPKTLASRHKLQGLRKISALEYFDMLEPRIDTPLLPAILRSAPVNWFFVAYYYLARMILSIFSGPTAD